MTTPSGHKHSGYAPRLLMLCISLIPWLCLTVTVMAQEGPGDATGPPEDGESNMSIILEWAQVAGAGLGALAAGFIGVFWARLTQALNRANTAKDKAVAAQTAAETAQGEAKNSADSATVAVTLVNKYNSLAALWDKAARMRRIAPQLKALEANDGDQEAKQELVRKVRNNLNIIELIAVFYLADVVPRDIVKKIWGREVRRQWNDTRVALTKYEFLASEICQVSDLGVGENYEKARELLASWE